MIGTRRVYNEPAWILHHRPYRDSSQLLDILSRDHGRLALVAKGSRRAKSRLRGILRPFLPLQMSWVIRSDLGTLVGAEMHGNPLGLTGDTLISGFYVSELILKLTHRHDPQPEIFELYSRTIERLVGSDNVAPALRQFEIALLRILGYALNLDHDTETHDPLDPGKRYEYRVEVGPVAIRDSARAGPMIFTGAELSDIKNERFIDRGVVKNATDLLKQVIAYHLEGKPLQSRKVLKEMLAGTGQEARRND
ncbi:MAG: DNA repair protein RecO [Woeseiaceae bacterium]|nr:DNA repair protein RecO [Woeseiaceae bacterium]